MKTIIKNKKMKKAIVITLLCLAILMLCLLLFVQKNQAANAMEKDCFTQGIYMVNGSKVDGDILIERGTFITVVVSYDGKEYVPQLYTDTNTFAYDIDGNTFAIKENSYIGGEMLLYGIIMKGDEPVLLQPIVIVPIWESNFEEKIVTVSSHDSYEICFMDTDIVSVKADISMKNGKTSKLLTNGSDIDDVINIAKHGYADLILDYNEITVNTADNYGNISPQTVTNGQENLNITPYTTRGLSGSGTLLNKYKIYDLEDLELLPNYDGGGKYFRQMNSFTIDRLPYSRNHNFLGIYDGYDKLITVDLASSVGSVFCNENNGTIRRLTFNIIKYSTSGLFAGIVCKKNYGTIYNVTLTTENAPLPPNFADRLTGEYAPIQVSAMGFGGITAHNYGTIYNCTVNIHMRSHMIAGGIAGANCQSGKIYNSTVVNFNIMGGLVTSLFAAGGIVGNNNSGAYVYNCSRQNVFVLFDNTSPDSTQIPRVGGIIGSNSANSNCVYGNSYSSSSNFSVEGRVNILESNQRVYIGQLYGYSVI